MKRFFVWFMSFFSSKQNSYPSQRKSTYGVERRRWSEQDDTLLVKLFKDNGSLLYMSLVLKRTEKAVWRRLFNLGYKYNAKKQKTEALRRASKADFQAPHQPIIAQDKVEPQMVVQDLSKPDCKQVDPYYKNHLYLKPLYFKPLVKVVSKPQTSVPVEPTKKPVRPKNASKPWTAEDDKAFIALHSAGHKPIDIATVLGRSEFAVLTHHNRLGLLPNR